MQEFTLEDAAQALTFIDPNCSRNEWAEIAMALKSEFGNQAFVMFDEWSQGGETYNANAAQSTFKSVSASGGTCIGTLIGRAQAGGYESKQKNDLTPEQKKQREAEQKKRRDQLAKEAKEDAAERAEWHEVNAEACERLVSMYLEDSGTSKYLQRKKVASFGLRFVTHGLVIVTHLAEKRIEIISGKQDVSAFFDRRKAGEIDAEKVTFKYFKHGTIAVPIRDLDGKLWALQFINEAGGKQFLKLSRKSGCFHLVNQNQSPSGELLKPDTPIIALAEGYATAASIHMATQWPCAVAFDAGNLARVAEGFRKAFPAARLVICGDNDAHKKTNTGRESAEKTALQVNGIAALPEFVGQAFNL